MPIHNNNLHYTPKRNWYSSTGYFIDYLFNNTGSKNPSMTIKECFNSIYDKGDFLEAIYSNLVEYDGYATDGCYWYYPDMDSPFPEDRFEGVYFAVSYNDPDLTVYVSEEESFQYAKEACLRFLEIHPEEKYRSFLMNILDNWKPLNGDHR